MPSFNQRLGVPRYEADAHYRIALEAYRKGDYETSIPEMNEAIRLLPTQAEYYAARGLMLLEDDAPNEARADFEAALKRFAYEVLALYGLGVLAYKDKQSEAAVGYFQRAHYADPKRPETLYYLALAHLQQGDLARASEAMMRAHGLFEAAGDKRKSDSARWLRELAREITRTAARAARQDAPRTSGLPFPTDAAEDEEGDTSLGALDGAPAEQDADAEGE